jgi:hypothetical protein
MNEFFVGLWEFKWHILAVILFLSAVFVMEKIDGH